MNGIGKLNIALIGVSHWHVPLYLAAVPRERLHITAVSDPDAKVSERVASELSCRAYIDPETLLDREKPDFVFAFAPHRDMPALAKLIISRKIPFTIEKPLGLCIQDVLDVQREAEKAGVFCAIPFIWRYSALIRELRERIDPADVLHMSFKFIAGPPSRYIVPSPWMLKSETAGSGCMTNLGVHFIDLALLLTRSEGGDVLGSAFHYAAGYDVEDYASALVRLSSGASLSIETGYAYPMDGENKRDNRWNFVTKKGYYTMGVGYFETREFGKPAKKVLMDTDSDVYYADFVRDSLVEYTGGFRPTAGLPDMARVRRILDAVIKKAGHGASAG